MEHTKEGKPESVKSLVELRARRANAVTRLRDGHGLLSVVHRLELVQAVDAAVVAAGGGSIFFEADELVADSPLRAVDLGGTHGEG